MTRPIDNKLKTIACLVGFVLIVCILNINETTPLLRGAPNSYPRNINNRLAIGAPPVYIPASLPLDTQRRLSLNLGGGACKWEPPTYDVPTDISFYKTLIAGFPSSDKRMTFTQMEALTGWPARDEWDFLYYGMTNHPFIKSNYPHHEGYWSWGTLADQVVMVVRNMRRTMVEYHDILWDIATAKNSNLPDVDVLYRYAPPIDSFFQWRDLRVMDEIHWYGWFIDYWMEGGLRRDIFSHELTTEDDWPYFPEQPIPPACLTDQWHAHQTLANTCTNSGIYTPPTPFPTTSPTTSPPTTSPTMFPTPDVTFANYTRPAVPYNPNPPPAPLSPPSPVPYLFNSAQECCQAEFPGQECFLDDRCPTPAPTPAIVASYDPHCANNDIANGCEPVAVISAEKLRDLSYGPAETLAIANVLIDRPGISEYLIDDEAWNCIWEELIPNGKGNRMVIDREGYVEEDYNFSGEMLQEMVYELDRLITKYSSTYWSSKSTATRLVQLLMEHRALIQMEFNDVNSGARTLTDRDFLGPRERELRRRLKAEQEGSTEEEANISVQEKKKHFEYFLALEEKVKKTQRRQRADQRQEELKEAAAKKKAQTRTA